MIEHLYKDHNEIHDCVNLLNKYSLDDLSAMISSGLFDDIYVGDYIEMSMTSDFGTETVRWLVAGINHFKHCGDTEVSQNHIVLLPEDSFVNTARMNPTNTTTGGYVNSEMFTTTLPKYNTAITNAFGSSHVLQYRQLLSNATASNPSMAGANFTGNASNWGWTSVKLNLMSEPLLYGTIVTSSSFYDVGIGKSQFPLFGQAPELIPAGRGLNGSTTSRYTFWLRAVTSSVGFCACTNDGVTNYGLSSASLGVRPYFLFI